MRSLIVSSEREQIKVLENLLAGFGATQSSTHSEFSMDLVHEQRPNITVLDTSTVSIEDFDELIGLITSEETIVVFLETQFDLKDSTQLQMQKGKLVEAIEELVDPELLVSKLENPKTELAASDKDRASIVEGAVWMVGVSSGATDALQELLNNVERPPSNPIIIAQHHPEGSLPLLVGALQKNIASSWRLKIIEDGDDISSADVFFVPHDSTPLIKGGEFLHLVSSPKTSRYTPSIDASIETVAQSVNGELNIVILTGLGNDGRRGVQRWGEKSKCVIVQDPETAQAPPMPLSIIDSFPNAIVGDVAQIGGMIR